MDEIRFTLRVPLELHQAIVAEARKNHRSMNSQILFWLEGVIDADTIPHGGVQDTQPEQMAQDSPGQDHR